MTDNKTHFNLCVSYEKSDRNNILNLQTGILKTYRAT